MRPPLSTLTVLLACAAMTTSCAGSPPLADAPPPRLAMPQTAQAACDLYRLPDRASQADLEIGYATRGAQLVACDGRRSLAVATAAAEHQLQDQWAQARAERRKPWWRFWAKT